MSTDTYNHILVITDALKSSDAVHETALNLARYHSANVTIASPVHQPGFLSKVVSANANEVFEMVVADKQQRLDSCAQKFRVAGVEVKTKVLIGRKSSEAIAREAAESQADLVVCYRKGVSSKTAGPFGNTARSLMRYCPTPILFVGDKPIEDPNVLACIDVMHDAKENASILGQAKLLGQQPSHLRALYCWEFYQQDLVRKQLSPDPFVVALEFAKTTHEDALKSFKEQYDLTEFSEVKIENYAPGVGIPKICKSDEIDVVVMCSASHNHPWRRLFGSTIEVVISNLACGLLVVKPEGFQSPMLKEAANATGA